MSFVKTRATRAVFYILREKTVARARTPHAMRACVGRGGGGEQSSAGRHIRHIVVAFAIRDLAIRRRWSCLVVYI